MALPKNSEAMKVLMLGWEFPPFISGGLGTACYGLTRAMSQAGVEIIFLLPRPVSTRYSAHIKLVAPRSDGRLSGSQGFELNNVTFRVIPSALQPYKSPDAYEKSLHWLSQTPKSCGREETTRRVNIHKMDYSENYGADLGQEVQRYADLATVIAMQEKFDIIHAHDWMTYPAGIAVAKVSGKPLVAHVHSTEFDRSGMYVNQMVCDIERQGLHHAKRVIAVSNLTRNIVVKRYGIDGSKVSVVYNAIERNGSSFQAQNQYIRSGEKIVLFLGRITMQKGPEYFLAAAKKVLEVIDNVKFVMAGSGNLMWHTIELAAQMAIGHKVLFTGFLHGEDVDRMFRMADLFVMPSVSEPFGLVPLEAMRNDVPVIISKQSGVAEVLTHALKVDFWDINEMANKIIAVLKHPPLQMTLRTHGNSEICKFSWKDSARQCLDIYQSALATV